MVPRPDTILLGLTWEAAKLHFGPVGLHGLLRGGAAQRLGCLALSTISLVLMVGSVGASMVCLAQADAQDQQRTLASSRVYADARRVVQSLDAQIETMVAGAQRDLAQGYRQRALTTTGAIADLRRQRADASAIVATMEMHPAVLAASPMLASLGALASGDANAECIRRLCHALVAVMLEVIGVAALCSARVRRGASAACFVPVANALGVDEVNATRPRDADATRDVERQDAKAALGSDAFRDSDAKCTDATATLAQDASDTKCMDAEAPLASDAECRDATALLGPDAKLNAPAANCLDAMARPASDASQRVSNATAAAFWIILDATPIIAAYPHRPC